MGSTCMTNYCEEPRSAMHHHHSVGITDYDANNAFCTQCMDFSNKCSCTAERQSQACLVQAFSEECLPEVTTCNPEYATLPQHRPAMARCQSASGCRQSIRRARHQSAFQINQQVH